MFLKKVHINDFKALKDVNISLEQNPKSNVFSVASLNGAGKSTLLQFIFVLLHSSFDNTRKQYVKNMLEGLYELKITDDELINLASFEIEDNEQTIKIEFFIADNIKGTSFDSFLDIAEIETKLEKNNSLKNKLYLLEKAGHDIMSSGRVSAITRKNIESYIETEVERELFYDSYREDDINIFKALDKVKDRIESEIDSTLDSLLKSSKKEQKILLSYLKEKNLSYSLHLDSQTVLLFSSNASKEHLYNISNKVFLAAPNTQVFLFLELEGRKELFNSYSQYYEYVRAAKSKLDGFFNYDFVSTNLIVSAFRNALDQDSKSMITTGEYGNSFKETQKSLNNFLSDKTICTNTELSKAFFKLKNSNKELQPEDLSHGELKRLGMYIWLKNNVPENSLVLMDEIDIGLHPNWQYELHDNLQEWSKDSQFILATHSPQIISNTHYKNLIILTKEKEKLEVKRYTKSPLDRDINTIIKTIMGADYIPRELQTLQNKYRTLFDNGQAETKEAKKLKLEILEYESEGSSFFQGIAFDKELMG